MLRSDRRQSLGEITDQFNRQFVTKISSRTVRRRLNFEGYKKHPVCKVVPGSNLQNEILSTNFLLYLSLGFVGATLKLEYHFPFSTDLSSETHGMGHKILTVWGKFYYLFQYEKLIFLCLEHKRWNDVGHFANSFMANDIMTDLRPPPPNKFGKTNLSEQCCDIRNMY
jgi:hypothetical protein